MYRIVVDVRRENGLGQEVETPEVLGVAWTPGWAAVVAARLAAELWVETRVERRS